MGALRVAGGDGRQRGNGLSHGDEVEPSGPGRDRRRRWRSRFAPTRRTVAVGAATAVAFVAIAAFLSICSRHAFAANSDGATVVLEGVAIRHGHLGLAGWTFAYDSFWSVDAIIYALGVLLAGVQPLLMHIVPAAIASGVVIVGVYAAGVGNRLLAAIAGAAVVVVTLALPSHAFAFFFLQGPWHVGTVLYCLVAFCALRSGRFGLGWAAGVAFLVAALLGDLQAVPFGVVAVFGAGVAESIRRRSLRVAAPTLTAGPASVLVAIGVRAIATRIGVFAIASGHHTAGAAQMQTSVRYAINWGAALFGLHGGPFGGAHIPHVVEAAHLLGALVAVAGVIAAAVTGIRALVHAPGPSAEPGLRLESCLVIACVANLVQFEALTLTINSLYTRYLTASVIFAVILGGRLVARLVTSASARGLFSPAGLNGRVVLAGGAVAIAAVVAAYATDVVIDLAQPAPRSPVADLVSFLENHNLNRGLGEYWGASIVTVESHAAVRVRPVAATRSGIIERDGRQSARSWYDGKTFDYIVYEQIPYDRITPTSIAKTYGAPAHTYHVDQYSIDVWSHPIGVSPESIP